MTGTLRAGIVFGIAALVAFVAGLVIPLPVINVLVAYGALLVLGGGAGYTAAKTAAPGTGRGSGRGAIAGAIAGVVVLILSTVALALVENVAAVRLALRDALAQTPQMNEPGLNPLVAANLAGAGSGLFLGLINLIVLVIGGIIGGALWRGAPDVTDTQPEGADQPTQTAAPGNARAGDNPGTPPLLHRENRR